MSPSSTEHAAPSPRWAWLLAIAFALVLLPSVVERYTPNTWLVGDGGFYLNMQKSLTRHRTLNQSQIHPHSWYEGGLGDIDDAFSNLSLGRRGEWWPKHSYLMPIAALPFYWVFDVTGTLMFNVLTMVLMIVLAYHLARELVSPGLAAATALAVGVSGPFIEYAYNYSNDGFYTVLAMASLLALVDERHVLAGLLFGVAVWAKITCVLLAPLGLAFLLWRGTTWRATLRFSLAVAAVLVGYGLANWYMFGRPWITSYQRVLVVAGGVLTTASHTDLFTVPVKEGLKELLLDDRRGLLMAYPLILVSWLGFVGMLLRRSTRVLAVGLLVAFAAMLAFYARYEYYQERFLFPVFALSALPGAVLAADLGRLVGALRVRPSGRLAAAGVVLALLAGGAVASSLSDPGGYGLARNIEYARVYLGDRHCDYFNNQRWAWECVRKDRHDSEFVGINAAHEHEFGGEKVEGLIFVRGHHSRQPRRLVFPGVTIGDVLRFRYGLDDRSRTPMNTSIAVHVAGEEVFTTELKTNGELHVARIDTGRWRGEPHDVVVTVQTPHRDRSRLCLDGWIE